MSAAVEFPLPAPTCDGLKVQVVSAGRFEQEKVTLLGKLAVPGFTSTVYVVDWPTGTDADCGFTPMLKSNAAAGRTVNTIGAECASEAGSLPVALMLNE